MLQDTFGIDFNETRLISYDELNSLECSNDSCTSSTSWIYGTSYWTGTTYNSSDVLSVRNNVKLIKNVCRYNYFGARPVIVISKSLIL